MEQATASHIGSSSPDVKPEQEGVMSKTITVKMVVMHAYFAMICPVSLCFILPRFGDMAVMVGSASISSLLVLVLPERFRVRNGSLMAATCLVSAIWLGAAVVTALTLMAKI